MDDIEYHRDVNAVGGGAREVELRLGAIDERDPPRRATCTVPKVVSRWRSCALRSERSTASAAATGPAASPGLR